MAANGAQRNLDRANFMGDPNIYLACLNRTKASEGNCLHHSKSADAESLLQNALQALNGAFTKEPPPVPLRPKSPARATDQAICLATGTLYT